MRSLSYSFISQHALSNLTAFCRSGTMRPGRENNRNVTVRSCARRKYLKLSQEEPRLISQLPLVSLQQDFRSYGLNSHQLLIGFCHKQQDRKGQHTSYISVLFNRHSSDLLLLPGRLPHVKGGRLNRIWRNRQRQTIVCLQEGSRDSTRPAATHEMLKSASSFQTSHCKKGGSS